MYLDNFKQTKPFLPAVRNCCIFICPPEGCCCCTKSLLKISIFVNAETLFPWHQTIWRTQADISACKGVWGAFRHLFAQKKYGFNWLSSCLLFRSSYQNTKLRSKQEQIDTIGANLIRALKSNTLNRCCAMYLYFWTLFFGEQGEKGTLFQMTVWKFSHKRLLSM